MNDFRPPWYLRNRHVQTLLGHLWSGPRFRGPTQRHLVAVSDGDQLVIHDSTPQGWRTGDPIGVLIHGLGGCHDSGHPRRFARLLAPRGIRTVRADLRGAGHGLPYARKSYHAGRSDDLRAILATAHSWSPTSPLWLIGVSLGGNMVLKLAGEAATDPVPGLQRVVALGPPIDMQRCATLMAQPNNRFYNRHFTEGLIGEVLRRQQLFPDLPSVAFPSKCTLRRYDELYTAPRNGFGSADEYYERSSSGRLIAGIRVATLIMTARDDPFIAVQPFEELRTPPSVTLHIIPGGGHLGFLAADRLGGMRWAEARVIDWLLSD